jgi:hypothetical protein
MIGGSVHARVMPVVDASVVIDWIAPGVATTTPAVKPLIVWLVRGLRGGHPVRVYARSVAVLTGGRRQPALPDAIERHRGCADT